MTSPFKRADHTARILGNVLEIEPVETLEALAPGGSSRKVVDALRGPRVDTIVLVGHEPDLGALAGLLVFNDGAALPLKKAGACSIRFDAAVAPGEGTLEWVASPRILRGLAGDRGAP